MGACFWAENGGVATDYFRLTIEYWGGKLVWGDFGHPYFWAKNGGVAICNLLLTI